MVLYCSYIYIYVFLVNILHTSLFSPQYFDDFKAWILSKVKTMFGNKNGNDFLKKYFIFVN